MRFQKLGEHEEPKVWKGKEKKTLTFTVKFDIDERKH